MTIPLKCPRCGSAEVVPYGFGFACGFCRHIWQEYEDEGGSG